MSLETDNAGSVVLEGLVERRPAPVIGAARAKTLRISTSTLFIVDGLVALCLFLSQLAQMGLGTALVAYLILVAQPGVAGAASEGTGTWPESADTQRRYVTTVPVALDREAQEGALLKPEYTTDDFGCAGPSRSALIMVPFPSELPETGKSDVACFQRPSNSDATPCGDMSEGVSSIYQVSQLIDVASGLAGVNVHNNEVPISFLCRHVLGIDIGQM